MPPTTQLKKLLTSIGDNPSQKDLSDALQVALAIILKIQQENEKKVQTAVRGDDGHTPTKEELLTLIRPLVPERVTDKELLKLIKPLIPKVKDGYTPKKGIDYFDGETPDTQKIIAEVLKQIPPPIPPESPPILTGDETIEVINSDDTEKKIKKERVEGLDEIERLARQKGGTPGGGITGKDFIVEIDISAQLDGSTKTFNLQAIYRILTVDLSSFPYALRKTTDYTNTATSITFTSEIDAPTQLAAGTTCIITAVI